MTAIAPTHEQRAAEFAAAVRDRLSDLPTDDLDELLDGLTADLAERLDEGGELGDPESYADELRQAAGLPARGEAPQTRGERRSARRENRRVRWQERLERTRNYWSATPGRRGVRDFVLALRPVWWVLRGLVAAWAVIVVTGSVLGIAADGGAVASFLGLLVCVASVIVGVQWGRGRWAPNAFTVALRRIASLLAVVLVLPATLVLWQNSTAPEYVETDPYPTGLSRDGEQISNIFAYDCAGQPLDGVQLYDQNGDPLTTLEGDEPPLEWNDDAQTSLGYERNGLAKTPTNWNVFPLWRSAEPLVDGRSVQAGPIDPPFAAAQPLSADCPVTGSEDKTEEQEKDKAASDADTDAAKSDAAKSDAAKSDAGKSGAGKNAGDE